VNPRPPEMLRLLLFDASAADSRVGLNDYPVFAEKRFPFLDGYVELRIIGASTLILVEAARFRLAEMLTCGPVPSGTSPLIEAGLCPQLESEGKAVYKTDPLHYEARIRTFPLSADATPRRSPSLPHFVSFRFPAEGPLTDVDGGEMKPGYLMFRTWHEYPENGVYIRSGSTWDFRPESERRAPLVALLATDAHDSS
jgi:hypothetical protein